jgi:hypothetical protein
MIELHEAHAEISSASTETIGKAMILSLNI